MSDNKTPKIVIEGITKEGKKFRPSDWAERMSGALSSFKGKRIHYDPRLVPMTNQDGNKCVLLDPDLKESNPGLYQSILEFAKKNELNICGQPSTEENSPTHGE
jgi:hypothetical protein